MRMTARRAAVLGLGCLPLLLTACTAGGTSTPSADALDPSASHAPANVSVWGAFTGREADILQASLDRLHQEYPWLTATYVPGKSDEDISKAVAAGNSPDITMSQAPDNVAKFCDTGAWLNLNSLIESSGLDMSATFPDSALTYTSYDGNQCSLPMLTDTYGLYYNKKLLANAGYDSPPKTMSELTDMAKKLTQRDSHGTIDVAGFVSTNSQMYETNNIYNGVNWGTQWYNDDGSSALATDPQFKALLEWDKELTDWYGYDNLVRWFAKYKDNEWDAGNAFEQGKVAMMMDGEWRGAFVAADHSDVDYGTAPFPVPDNMTDTYGVGQIGGTVVGIPRDAADAAVSFLVLQYLTTDTNTLNTLAERLQNVPTTYDSLKTTSLSKDAKFKPFIDIFQNPNSRYKQITPSGQSDVDTFSTFVTDYEKGKVADLQKGLEETANLIDQQNSLG